MALVLGEKDLLRLAVLLAALPVLAAWYVGRTRYKLACGRTLEPHRTPVGAIPTPDRDATIKGKDGNRASAARPTSPRDDQRAAADARASLVQGIARSGR